MSKIIYKHILIKTSLKILCKRIVNYIHKLGLGTPASGGRTKNFHLDPVVRKDVESRGTVTATFQGANKGKIYTRFIVQKAGDTKHEAP